MFGFASSLRQAAYISICFWIVCQVTMTASVLLYIGFVRLTKEGGNIAH